MHLGSLFDLALLAIAIATMVGWVYFWFLCVSRAEKLIKPLLGRATEGVVYLGFPFAFFGLLYLLIKSFGTDASTWFFLALGIGLPALGIWSIKSGKWD